MQVVRTDVDVGLIVEVAPHIRALVPVIHMSDLGKEAARKKFKARDREGAERMVQGTLDRLGAGAVLRMGRGCAENEQGLC